jgi:hypothetical protein
MGRTFHSREANEIIIAFVESEYPNDFEMQDDLQDRLLAAFNKDENPELQGDYLAFKQRYLKSSSPINIEKLSVFGIMGFTAIIGWINRVSIYNYISNNISERMINILGFTGGFMQLGAVAAVSRGTLENTSVAYHTLSLIGSSGLLLNAFYYGANPAVVINLIWMSMNVLGIVEGVSKIDILDNIPSLTMELPRPVAV